MSLISERTQRWVKNTHTHAAWTDKNTNRQTKRRAQTDVQAESDQAKRLERRQQACKQTDRASELVKRPVDRQARMAD